MPAKPISGGSVQNVFTDIFGSKGFLSLSASNVIFSLSLSSQFHPRPLAISNSLLGVPTSRSTGLGPTLPPCLTSSCPFSASAITKLEAKFPLIFDAVLLFLLTLGVFALDAQRTRSFEMCNKDLAKDESWRESSWVGDSINARGLICRPFWGVE